MSTTEAGRLTAFGKPEGTGQGGVSLQAVIESARRLDELSCARVVGNIADAVHAAQRGGQPLASLTPAAVVLLPDGAVKLVSGAASPRYTAPERLRGGTGDRRTDVFALGVVLWEALAHERLFDGASEDALKQAVLERAIRPPSELNANVPAELDAICKKALARDPADRYQSAKVMAAEIDAVLGDAGYPETNEQIARYVARAIAAEPAAAPNPPGLPSLQLPSKVAAPPPTPAGRPPPAAGPNSPAGVSPLAPGPGVMATAPGLAPPVPVVPPAAAEDTIPSLVVPAMPPAPGVAPPSTPATGRRSPGSATLAGTAPPSAAPNALARTTPSAGVPKPAGGTLPSLPAIQRPAAPAATSSATAAPAEPAPAPAEKHGSQTTVEPALRAVARPAKTEILGSLPPGSLSLPPEKPQVAVTAFLGSAASTPAAPANAAPANPALANPVPAHAALTISGAPRPAMSRAPAAATTSPSVAPASIPPASIPPASIPPASIPPASIPPASIPPQAAASARSRPPTPPAHPHPPVRPSIANAETIATPQLSSQIGFPSAVPTLDMPPGMTVAPATPPVPLQSVEHDPDEANPDPAEVVALHRAERSTGGRDVLSGWGWSTGTVEAIDDEDFHDTARASRKRLMIAIGGALGVVMVIAIIAFAFSGSPPASDQDKHAMLPAPVPTPVPAAPATAPATAQPPEPAAAPAAAPTAPNAGPPTPADPNAGPPAPEPAAQPPPPEPTSVEPAKPEPAKPEPARPEPTSAAPAAVPPPEPVKAAAIPAPTPEPVKAAAIKAPTPEPARAAVATRPEPPAKPSPAIKAPEPRKPELPKAATPKAEPAKKLEAKKPPEPRPPERALKRPLPPDKLAQARLSAKPQPLDPYAATADRPAADPAAAYKTGLQQYARGDTAGALATFRSSLSSNPNFASTWRGIGLVYEKMGNKGQARAAFKRYLQLAPDAGDADQIRDRMERLGP